MESQLVQKLLGGQAHRHDTLRPSFLTKEGTGTVVAKSEESRLERGSLHGVDKLFRNSQLPIQ